MLRDYAEDHGVSDCTLASNDCQNQSPVIFSPQFKFVFLSFPHFYGSSRGKKEGLIKKSDFSEMTFSIARNNLVIFTIFAGPLTLHLFLLIALLLPNINFYSLFALWMWNCEITFLRAHWSWGCICHLNAVIDKN